AQAMVMNLELNLVLRNSRNIHGNEVMIFPFPDVASRGPFAFTEATRLRLISGAPEIIEKTVEFGTELAQRILARVYGLKLTHKSFPPSFIQDGNERFLVKSGRFGEIKTS